MYRRFNIKESIKTWIVQDNDLFTETEQDNILNNATLLAILYKHLYLNNNVKPLNL